MGESSGEPRHVFSPDLFAESFSAAVDYLGVQVPFVDREKIGVIGICGSGGFSLAAAAADTRIKAIATASMYDMTDVRGMNNFSKEQLDEFKDKLTRQRWEDYANEMSEYKPFFMQMLMQFQIWIQLLKNGLDSMLCPVASIKMLVVVLQLLLIYQCFNGAI